jgi:hypothetical protein
MTRSRSKRLTKFALSIPVFVGMFILVGAVNHQLKSASLTSVSVTSSNPRPSFRGALGAGNVAGTSTVIINTTAGAYPSTSSAQLVQGDSLRIGSAGIMGTYTVASTSSLSTFNIAPVLAAGDADAGDDVISTSAANLTVRFTTANAIQNGRFRVLLPALTSATAQDDGIPDSGAFDFGTSAPVVTCPTDVGATYDFTTGTATAGAVTIGTQTYHAYECAYSGTGAIGSAFSTMTIAGVINPAPKTGHTLGTADTYNVVVQQLDGSQSVQDTTTVAIAVVEAVKVTASVAPQITFQIIGLPAGTAACGTTSQVPTTPTSVPFGEISISSFTNATQALAVSTNAVGGFAVTAAENDQLGKDGAACAGTPTVAANPTCIPDALGTGTMSETVSNEWTNATSVAGKGFGYALHDINGTTTEAFAYNESARTFSARQFADLEAAETPATLFSGTTVADNQNVYVCYRIVAANTTAAGNYENYVTYNATATF